jgi:hypothetical protein
MRVKLSIDLSEKEYDLDRLLEMVGDCVYYTEKVYDKITEKNCKILEGWELLGDRHSHNDYNTWGDHSSNKPGLYLFKRKGKPHLFSDCLYIGESTDWQGGVIKRIKAWEAAWRGKTTNHGTRIYEARMRLEKNGPLNDIEIWFRPHKFDGDNFEEDNKSDSQTRERMALAAHYALHGRFTELNVRDLPYWLANRMREKLIETGAIS